jgi:predicted DNA-binding transcriptional regulator AlpA
MKLLNYTDLVAMGVVRSRMTLWRMIQGQGFPPGILISANRRAWLEEDVRNWLASRPVTKASAADGDQSDSRDAERASRDSASSTGEAA